MGALRNRLRLPCLVIIIRQTDLHINDNQGESKYRVIIANVTKSEGTDGNGRFNYPYHGIRDREELLSSYYISVDMYFFFTWSCVQRAEESVALKCTNDKHLHTLPVLFPLLQQNCTHLL